MKNLSNPTNAFYFECSKPFKVQRDASLVAYSYEGNFVAIIDSKESNNQIQIVNLIESEKYIQGVVPAEVGNAWPVEALKAQAVAARTFAWWTVLDERVNSGNTFDLDDTVQYQAYSGISNHTTVTDAAVSDTANQVMKYQGKVIKAYFSADSGGKSESSKNAFGQVLPYCISKSELYDITKTKTAWEVKIPLADISTALSINIKQIEVEVGDFNTSGRVDQVTITNVNGQKTKISGPLFRKALKLRSTLFELKTESLNNLETVTISGKGFGHGVGMAQVGAKQYALQLGWTFDQIVKFYYTGITLESVTNEYTE